MEHLNQIYENMSQIVVVVSIALAVLLCFSGYRLVKLWVRVIGFLAGFCVGFILAHKYLPVDTYVSAAIGILAGILVAFVAFKLYLAGLFICCGFLAASAAAHIPYPEGDKGHIIMIAVSVAAFLVVGLLAVRFQKKLIILLTAITGAVQAISHLKIPVEALAENQMLRIGSMVVLAVAGMLIQSLTTRRN